MGASKEALHNLFELLKKRYNIEEELQKLFRSYNVFSKKRLSPSKPHIFFISCLF